MSRIRLPFALCCAILVSVLAGCSAGAAGSASNAPAQTEAPGGAAATTPATGEPQAAVAPEQSAQQQPAPRPARDGFLVALDPGHGGDESGAAAYGVVERDSNLDMAQRVEAYLQAAGVQVHLTRRDNGRATGLVTPSGDNRPSTRADLQARVIEANRLGADIFVSLHSNGSSDPTMRGFEVYYDSRRPFADQSQRLAKELLDGALRGAANAGYASPNRGIIDAACWRNFNGRCVGLFVLSPGGAPSSPSGSPSNATPTGTKEATNMPAALLESLFISSPDDAAMLKDDAVRSAIAKGIADGILRYLGVVV